MGAGPRLPSTMSRWRVGSAAQTDVFLGWGDFSSARPSGGPLSLSAAVCLFMPAIIKHERERGPQLEILQKMLSRSNPPSEGGALKTLKKRFCMEANWIWSQIGFCQVNSSKEALLWSLHR